MAGKKKHQSKHKSQFQDQEKEAVERINWLNQGITGFWPEI
jgi:hypothetical protein